MKYPCGQCEYQSTRNGSLDRHKRSVHEERKNIHASNVSIKQQEKTHSISTKDQFMKELNILASNVCIKPLQKEVLIGTKYQFMRE